MTVERSIAVGGFAALIAVGVACQPTQPQVGASSRGVLESVSNFGSNPGNLAMFKYVPANPAPSPALVVALHACVQDAEEYEKAGWNALADQHGFVVLYPEQQAANNSLGCFNWSGEGTLVSPDTANLERGQGENQSIIEMIDTMVRDHGVDPQRVYIMGHSGGAAQTTLMVALWPDRFAGAGVIAGIPYRCTTSLSGVTFCLNPGTDRTPQAWGDLARMGHPTHTGAWPKMTIWHGASDFTVAVRNQTEILQQFTNLYGIDDVSDAVDTIGSADVSNYHDALGQTLVQTVTIPGFGHGTPVDASSGCGASGTYFIDSGICAVQEMASFWGLIGGPSPGDVTAPTVDVTAPSDGSSVMGSVMVTLTASDDVAVVDIELFVNGVSEAVLTAPPYTYVWDTSGLANGSYAIRAVARDAAGNAGVDDDTSVTVQGAQVDTQAPVVHLTAPAPDEMVSGQVQLMATATDDFGVAEVEFFIDGTSLGVLQAPPYAQLWDARAIADGTYTVAVQARDAASNQAEAMLMVTVTGGMPPDSEAPMVSFTELSDGDAVQGLIRVEAEAMDNERIAAVLLFLDGVRIGTDLVRPYSFLWDTAQVATGTHTLSLSALDASGNAGPASVLVDVQRAPDPQPQDPAPGSMSDTTNSRWGCSTAPGGAEPLGLLGFVAAAILFAGHRRRASNKG